VFVGQLPLNAAGNVENKLLRERYATLGSEPEVISGVSAGGFDAPEFPAMIEALRNLQDAVAGFAAPTHVLAEATQTITELSRRLGEYAVNEKEQLCGKRLDLPGRAQAMSPPVHIDEQDERSHRGRLTFSRFYLGNDGGVHAGAIPLAFTEVLFWLAVSGASTPTRTAYLNVDYVSLTPIEEELQVAAWLEREEGRKRFVRGTMHAGDRLCARAEGLYVRLLPGRV
jgi:hypothetical protein